MPAPASVPPAGTISRNQFVGLPARWRGRLDGKAPVRDILAGVITERFIRQRHRAAVTSFVVGFGMLAIKMGAYLATGSATILSDALESVVHVAATGFMFFCFRLASQPPDANHPYGHGKAEYLSVGFEGGMILLAALAIVWQAVRDLLSDHRVESLDLGFGLIAGAAVINLALGAYLLRVGKRTNSAILIGDGHHVLSDVWTSLGVLIGLSLMWFVRDDGTRAIIDSVVAIALAIFIVVTASKLIRRAVAGLLDEVDDKLLVRVVDAINEIRDANWIDIHNLRLRSSGDLTYVDFHLTVPAEWTIAQGHASEERLESHILSRLGSRGSVMIHLDHPHVGEPVAAPRVEPFTVDIATRVKAD
jgi:cation diffusion facilitator family transporter